MSTQVLGPYIKGTTWYLRSQKKQKQKTPQKTTTTKQKQQQQQNLVTNSGTYDPILGYYSQTRSGGRLKNPVSNSS